MTQFVLSRVAQRAYQVTSLDLCPDHVQLLGDSLFLLNINDGQPTGLDLLDQRTDCADSLRQQLHWNCFTPFVCSHAHQRTALRAVVFCHAISDYNAILVIPHGLFQLNPSPIL